MKGELRFISNDMLYASVSTNKLDRTVRPEILDSLREVGA